MNGVQINPGRKAYYEKMGWWGEKTLLDYWRLSVTKFGAQEYIVDNRGNRITYTQMDGLSDKVAGWFYAQGIRPLDVITVQVPIWHEFVVVALAGLKLGAVVNPIGMSYEAEELSEILKLVNTKAFVAPTYFRGIDRSGWPKKLMAAAPSLEVLLFIENEGHSANGVPTYGDVVGSERSPYVPPPPDANEVCAILCTSGTTAGPKAVMFTHNNLIYSELQFGRMLKLTNEDIMFMPAPLSHATGFHHGMICNMIYGAKVVLQEKFDRATAIDYMNEENCTYSMGATPFVYDILKELEETGKSLPTLKYYLCGGAPLPGLLVHQAWEKHKILVCEVYGSTESTPHVLVRPGDALSNYGMTAGRPIPGTEIKIVDDSRHIRCYGFPGEEASRGPGVFVGYYNNATATRANLDEDGWFYSGDMGMMDERGNLKIIGRKKDIIIRGGENLSINKIANYLLDFPAMEDFAILGCPDDRMGERICAYIVPKDRNVTVTKEDVIKYLSQKSVSKRYWPERVEMIDAIPRTESGKVKRYLLENDIRPRMGLLVWRVRRTMSDQTFGPCRSRVTTKPRQSYEDPLFYVCRTCGRATYSLGNHCGAVQLNCCGSPVEQLAQQNRDSLPAGHEIDYQIVGGFNNNAIKLSWSSEDPEFRPRWVFLKTYTGGQFKFIPENKKSPAVFPLADEDAYAYCDEDPCLECVFCCKLGFSFFVYFERFGLFALPVDRKKASWQSLGK